MSTATSGIGSTIASAAGSTANNSQLSISPTDFLNMMVTQLENQDPFQPTDSNTLLTQMSEIGQLQSSSQLQSSLSGLMLQNQIGAASGLIGKSIQGTDANSNPVSGNVTSVQVAGSNVSLQLDSGDSIGLGNVTSISTPATAMTGAAGTPTTQPTAG